MADDYYKTALRMWEDANILFNSSQKNSWFNTCYLSGYILECYGKLLISLSTFGGSYGHRLGDINNSIQNSIINISVLAKYCLDFNSNCNTIFVDPHKWDPKKRYEGTSASWDSEAIAKLFLQEAEIVFKKVTEMKLDGVI